MDDVIEDVVGKKILTIWENEVKGNVMSLSYNNRLYLMLDVISSLTKGMSSATKSCADTGLGNKFCPKSLCVSLKIQIEQCRGRRYNYRDANNKPVVVIGEAVLCVVLPDYGKPAAVSFMLFNMRKDIL